MGLWELLRPGGWTDDLDWWQSSEKDVSATPAALSVRYRGTAVATGERASPCGPLIVTEVSYLMPRP